MGLRQRIFSPRTALHLVGALPATFQFALGPDACGQLAAAERESKRERMMRIDSIDVKAVRITGTGGMAEEGRALRASI
jgi:hypothetical protein